MIAGMAAARQQAQRKGRRGRRAGGVLVVLLVAWLAGRGFMAGRGAAPAAGAATSGGAAVDGAQREPTPAVGASPGGESKAADGASKPAPTDPALASDRIAALCDAVTAELARGDLAMAAQALHRARGDSIAAAAHPDVIAVEAAARAAALAIAGEGIELLRQGRALAAAARLRPFASTGAVTHGDPLALLPEPLQSAARVRLGVRLRDGALAPAPRPLARGRTLTAWRDGGQEVGVCVAGDAESVTLRVGRADAASFPTAAYADCEPHEPSAAEAIECGFAAARAGRPTLAGAWLRVAELRGGAPSPRWQALADLLR
jgi:hypothetical protein